MTRAAAEQPESMGAAPSSGEIANDTLALYARLRALRWGDGFSGPYAECLCAILTVLGRNLSVRQVVEIMPHFENDFHLIDLMNAAVNLGLDVKQARPADKDKFETPALVLMRQGFAKPPLPHVVLSVETQNGARRARLYDSTERAVRMIDLDRDPSLRGAVFYSFPKLAGDRQENAATLRAGAGLGWFRALAIRFYGVMAQILCLSFLSNMLGLATPLFIMMVYDRVISARVTEAFAPLVAGVTIAIACDWVLRGLRARRRRHGGRGGRGDGSGDEPMKGWTYAYALIVVVGGVMAYVKKGSTQSLVASSGVAVLLLIAASLMGVPTSKVGTILALATAVGLAAMMGLKAKKTGKVVPVVVSVYSAAMACGYMVTLM